MQADELAFLSVQALAPLIRRREISPVDLVRALHDRIERYNGTICSYITVLGEESLQAAARAEREIMAGQYRGPLHGIPVAHKDIYLTKGIRTTAHSKLLADYIPDHDATVVQRLAAAGTILLGKLNTHEFACGDMEVFGHTRNPWNRQRITSGSSSGSANALAAGLITLATGSDTGGSIRIPASFCGIVGLKPTYGRVSRYGVLPLSWSLDHTGPMTRTVWDNAAMLNAIAGYDPLDPASSGEPVADYTAALTGNVAGLRIGVPANYFFDDVDPAVQAAVMAAIRQLAAMGAALVDMAFPHMDCNPDVTTAIITAEAASIHEKELRTRPELFSENARQRFELGAVLSAMDYLKAQRLRSLVIADFARAFEQVDVIVTPTTPIPAYAIGTGNLVDRAGKLVNYRRAVGPFTNPSNLSGLPSLSLPCGFTADGLPIGLQVIGRAFDEATVLRVGHAYEQASPWHTRRPVL